MQLIKVTQKYPNQSISFTASRQNITLNLYWRGYQGLASIEQDYINYYAQPNFFADIFVGSSAIIEGQTVINKQPINQYPSDFIGYIASIDTSGNNENPSLTNLGVTVFLYYLDDLTQITGLIV